VGTGYFIIECRRCERGTNRYTLGYSSGRDTLKRRVDDENKLSEQIVLPGKNCEAINNSNVGIN